MSLNTRVAKAYMCKSHFKGLPKKTDINLVEETLRNLKEGEYLTKAIFIKIDPNLKTFDDNRGAAKHIKGIQVAKVIESKNKNFPVDKYVVGEFGWRTLTIGNDAVDDGALSPYLLPKLGDLPISLALGPLGVPGNAAYFGFIEICKPKEGDTVVISSAGGAIGSHVGQIAKLKGCKVIGITGCDEKVNWLTSKLGFDYCINYKKQNLKQKLQEYAPNGIDCYFDNVGGEISSTVIYCLKTGARVCICGVTSLYYCNEESKAFEVQTPIKIKTARMEGMLINRWFDRWSQGITQNLQWIREGKLNYKETVTEGFENVIQAYFDVLEGKNIGNAIVAV